MERVSVFGLPVDNVSLTDAIDRIAGRVAEHHRSGHPAPMYVATINVDFLANSLSLLRFNPEKETLGAILRRADLVTADGMPLIWLSNWWNTPLKARVAGSDLVPSCLKVASANQWKVQVIGSDPETYARFQQLVGLQFPGIRLATPFLNRVLVGAGSRLNESETEIRARIETQQPDLVLFALGNPKQELLWNRLKPHLNAPVVMGIGGSIDLLVGKRKRAPVWIQNLGAEWMIRWIQEPMRLGRRYFIDAWSLVVLCTQSVVASGVQLGNRVITAGHPECGLPDPNGTASGTPCVRISDDQIHIDAGQINRWSRATINKWVSFLSANRQLRVILHNPSVALQVWLTLNRYAPAWFQIQVPRAENPKNRWKPTFFQPDSTVLSGETP